MKTNNIGLIKVTTNGAASGTTIEVDGHEMALKRATIIIDPKTGYNEIKVHGISCQREVSTFYGISKENYEFMEGLMERLSAIGNDELEHHLRIVPAPLNDEVMSIYELLDYVREQRKTPSCST